MAAGGPVDPTMPLPGERRGAPIPPDVPAEPEVPPVADPTGADALPGSYDPTIAVTPVVVAPRPVDAKAPKKRGRPKKSEPTPAEAAPADETVDGIDHIVAAAAALEVEGMDAECTAPALTADAEKPLGPPWPISTYDMRDIIVPWLSSGRQAADLDIALERMAG